MKLEIRDEKWEAFPCVGGDGNIGEICYVVGCLQDGEWFLKAFPFKNHSPSK